MDEYAAVDACRVKKNIATSNATGSDTKAT